MKLYIRTRALALLLAAITVAAILSPNTLALSRTVSGVGTLYWEGAVTLGDQTTLYSTTLQHSNRGREEERYIEWSPNTNVRPIVATGATLYGDTTTPTTMYNRLKSSGYTPVALINGDYFNTSNGVPEGIVITNGILRASASYEYAVGFQDNGGAFISKSTFTINMAAQTGSGTKNITIDTINHGRTANNLALFTPDYSSTTRTTTEGTHIVLSVSGALKIGPSVTGTIVSITNGTAAASLKSGQMVLSVAKTGPTSRVEGLAVGQTYTLSITSTDSRFSACSFALGGYQKLVTGGEVVSTLANDTAPRTAIGIKADGTCVLYTVDGRQSGWSNGLGLKELAKRLVSLGCVEAVNLDGGGSTALGAVYAGQESFSLRNKPSDGSARSVTNYIALVNTAAKTGVTDKLFVYPARSTALVDATVQLTAYATDENYHKTSTPSIDWDTNDWDASIDANGRFTATAAGEYQAIAVESDGWSEGAATVRVVDRLTSFSVVNESTGKAVTSLSLSSGQAVSLAVSSCVYDHESVTAQDSLFIWSVSGFVGAVDANGTFTAAHAQGATGSLTVSYGDTKVTIPVSVGSRATALETFEGTGYKIGPQSDAIAFAAETDLTQVKFGFKSGHLTYSFATGVDSLTCAASISLPSSANYVHLWVKGSGKNETLSLRHKSTGGNVSTVSAGTLNFSGWRQLHVKLPSSGGSVTGLVVGKGTASGGHIYLDQIMASPGATENNGAPTITVQTVRRTIDSNPLITANISGGENSTLAKTAVTVKLDNRDVDFFSFGSATGQLSVAPVIDDTLAHRLTIEVSDVTGSIVRASVELPRLDDAPLPRYEDVPSGHWASAPIELLASLGVFDDTNPLDTFAPDTPLTRADMAVYMAKVMRLDLTKYKNVTLPFTDMHTMDAKTTDALKALYSLGVTQGRSDGSGHVFYDPNARITRAEFFTILGRTLPRGYLGAPKTFTDSASVASYAAVHFELLSVLGLVDGYPDGSVRPRNNVTRAEAAKLMCLYM